MPGSVSRGVQYLEDKISEAERLPSDQVDVRGRRGRQFHKQPSNADDLLHMMKSIYYRYWSHRNDIESLVNQIADRRHWLTDRKEEP